MVPSLFKPAIVARRVLSTKNQTSHAFLGYETRQETRQEVQVLSRTWPRSLPAPPNFPQPFSFSLLLPVFQLSRFIPFERITMRYAAEQSFIRLKTSCEHDHDPWRRHPEQSTSFLTEIIVQNMVRCMW